MTYGFKSTLITLLLVVGLMAPAAFGQSLTSGDITGTVTDPTHAVVANAPVVLKSLDTGSVQTVTTNNSGFYRFSLLKPGNYQVTVNQSGFAEVQVAAPVLVGESTTRDITLSVTAKGVTVEVTGTVPVVDTTSASISTAFTQQEVALLPSAGGDITNIAQTAPGVQMNNTAGYGNFTVNGMPATSNLFTVNGENDMDPYFNINNSGATNLTIGSNEIQEATVVANPYSAEFGQLAGAQVISLTKSGTNNFHGNALYWWNGSTMNANDWMFNNGGTAKPRSNANQWATSVGGPVIKDKTFFFFDTEGLRFVLPNTFLTNIPTPAFANAVLANVANLQPNESPLYKQMMNMFASAPGAGSAKPITNNAACNGLTGLTSLGFDPTTQNCFAAFSSSAGTLGSEWILAFKIDQYIKQNDKLFVRYKLDHGLQPTLLNAVSPAFNALSNQPSWDVQMQESHIFSPSLTNEFTLTGSHYVAQFQQNQAAALNEFPMDLLFGGTNPLGPASAGGEVGYQHDFPQGRNISQYQVIDNLSWTTGNHAFKFGLNFRRYDISDHNFFYNNALAYFDLGACKVNESPCLPADQINALQMFTEGIAGQYRKSLNLASNVPIALWGAGFYGMDTWKVKSNLTLTLAMRMEHNSNPVCQHNCLTNFKSDWASLPSVQAGPAGAGDVPYTSDIGYNLNQAFPSMDTMNFSPRFGFSWSPRGNSNRVISGGFGIFYDNPAAGLVDDLLADPPVAVAIRVRPTTGTLPFDPTSNGSSYTWGLSAQAFNSGFASGQTYTQIHTSLLPYGVNFAAPAFTSIAGTMHSPMWEEWNLQLQQQLGNATAVIVNYVGNHGLRIPYENGYPNAYDGGGIWPTGTLPPAVPVPNYGTVIQVQSGAISNYAGLTVSVRHNFSKWFSAHANYTWSHTLDELSNGGVFQYNESADSFALNQLCPQSLRACNYGNADYDIRHSFNADYVVHPSYHFSNGFLSQALGGWEWSGKMFWRSGLPFSVVDGNLNGGIVNGTATVLATPILPGPNPGQGSCGRSNASVSGTATPCLNAAAFLDTGYDPAGTQGTAPAFSRQTRNQYRGPHFFDIDMSLFKNFKFGERFTFALGAQAFNVFNHPNFQGPDNYLGDSTFGQISAMTPMPTSPYGTFLGFDSSVRVVQVAAKIIF